MVNNLSEVNNSAPAPKVHHRSIVAIIVVALVVAACVVGAIYYNNHHQASSKAKIPTAAAIKASESKGSYSFIYSGKLKDYSVSGGAAGQGIAFSAPVEFTEPVSGGTQQVQLIHSLNKGGVIQPFGEISAASAPSGPLPPAYLSALSAALAASPTDPTYISTIKSLQDFTQGRVGTNYTLKYDTAKAFTSPNIKTNAWSMDFSGSPTKAVTGMIQPEIKGQAVLAAAANGFYYFVISAASSNWTNNQTLWNQVFNSLKIEQ